MRKVATLLIIAICFTGILQAQPEVILDESFTQGVPNTWTIIENDGAQTDSATAGGALAAGTNIDFTSQGWRRLILNQGARIAMFSSGAHDDTTIQADDWLITPALVIDSFTELSWQARSFGSPLTDYVVRISTDSVRISDFLLNPVLDSTTAEPTAAGLDYNNYTLRLDSLGYTNDTVYIAFVNRGNGKQPLLSVDNIEVTKFQGWDIDLSNLSAPQSTCTYSGNDQISVQLNNEGLSTWTSVSLTLVVDTGLTPSNWLTLNETWTGTLAADGDAVHTFAPSFDFNGYDESNPVSIRVIVNEATDQVADNDTVSRQVIDVTPSNIPYTTNLDDANARLGWITDDVLNDGTDFLVLNGAGRNTSNAYTYLSDGSAAGDDWLISTCLNLDDTRAYTLDFYEKIDNFGNYIGAPTTPTAEHLQVWIGNAPTPDSMSTRLLDLPSLNNAANFDLQTIDFTVPSSGVWYIGFKALSDAQLLDMLIIDDVSVTEVPAPVAGFTTTINGLDVTVNNTSTGFINSISLDMGDGTTPLTGFPSPYSYTSGGNYTICLTVTNPSGSDSVCQTITLTVGIEELLDGEVAIYPNPATDRLFLDVNFASNRELEFELIDITGRSVIRESLGVTSSDKREYALDGFAAGLYVARLSVDGVSSTRKVVIR